MKRIASSFLACIMILACTCTAASATSDSVLRASLYLTKYAVSAAAGSSAGQLLIGYDVSANTPATSIGVSKIVIYKSDGSRVTTITGTTSNGLIRTSGNKHTGDYIYSGVSGTSYYAEVTVFAGDANGSDSRTITTSVIKTK